MLPPNYLRTGKDHQFEIAHFGGIYAGLLFATAVDTKCYNYRTEKK